MPRIDKYLLKTIEKGGTDLHISVDQPPLYRYRGELLPLTDEVLTRTHTRLLIYELLTEEQRNAIEMRREVEFAYSIPGYNRFRCNAYRQRLGIDAVFHVIPNKIPPLGSLGLPKVVYELTKLDQGLLLIAGPRGSGKSTTCAAMIDYINETRKKHIITVEDPIEFIHTNKLCLINQREVGIHTNSFAVALKHALRADPDVIMVGEMRDLETISMAVTAAETGHLVIATLHTINAVQTIDRIIDIFPGTQKLQIRMMVSESLKAIICQQLIPSRVEDKMELAYEILINIPAISNLIRDGKTYQIHSIMQMGSSYSMITMDDCLYNLVVERRISLEDALIRARDKRKLLELKKKMMRRGRTRMR